MPTSLGLILTAIPAERRAHSIRIWAVSGSLGAAAGPALGGLLVQVSWRSIFLLNVPIGIAALVGAALLAPARGTATTPGARPARRARCSSRPTARSPSAWSRARTGAGPPARRCARSPSPWSRPALFLARSSRAPGAASST